MKRFALLLALIMVFACAGCCYAPGYTGSMAIEKIFDEIETVPGEMYMPIAVTEMPVGLVTESSGELVAIPDPGVDLAAFPQYADDDMVNVLDYIPDLVVDLKYATAQNFTGKTIYTANYAVYLRFGTVKKLMQVQAELRQQGMLLKLWDGFRSVKAHQRLWDAYPDGNYVADPAKGGSTHSRGNTVDVTLVNGAGQELNMPTGFDDFTVLADRDYSDCSNAAGKNATLLQEIMERNGFTGLDSEWWHFTDTDDYPVEEVLDPDVIGLYYAKCNEYINLRANPSTSADSLAKIGVNKQFTVLAVVDEYFSWIDYDGQRGYVLTDYTEKVK